MAKNLSLSKQRMREHLEREEHIWRGVPGPNKLDSYGKPFIQSKNLIQNSYTDQSMKAGGDTENEATEMKGSQITANGNGTSAENNGTSQEMRQDFTSTQHGRGSWDYGMTRQRQPRYQTQSYSQMSHGFNHQDNFGGEGEDMRPGMQKFSTQRPGNGHYFNRNHAQRGNSRGNFHRGGGGKTNLNPMTMHDPFGKF